MNAKYELIKYDDGMYIRLFNINHLLANPHWHNELELVFVIDGTLHIKIDENDYNIGSNSVAIVNRGQVHSMDSDHRLSSSRLLLVQISDQFLKNLNISVQDALFANFISACEETPFYSEDTHKFIELAKDIIVTLESKERGYDAKINLICCNLISLLQEHHKIPISEEYKNFRDKNQERMKRIFTYIEANYTEEISLEELAEKEHISTYYLSRFFKQYASTTFSQYLNNYRISKAQLDLLHTQDPITDIYFKHGFNNSKTFNRSFRQIAGCSPSEYRKLSVDIADFPPDGDASTIETAVGTYVCFNDQIKATQSEYIDGNAQLVASTLTIANKTLSQIAPIEIVADFHAKTTKYEKYYKKIICTGRAHDILKARFREHFDIIQQSIGFSSIRCHGIFNDEMGVITIHHDEPYYNFYHTDEVYDYLLSQNCKPYVELGFMPESLKTSEATFSFYKANISPPNDYEKWSDLIHHFITHLINRYSKAEVLTWNFEIWNEPDLISFWDGDFEEYLRFYKVTARAIKDINNNIKIGGPSSCSDMFYDTATFTRFLEYCTSEKLSVDFISVHPYPVYVKYTKPANIEIMQDENNLTENIRLLKDKLIPVTYKDVPIHMNEWNSSPRPNDLVHDTAFMATFVIQNILRNLNQIDSLAYWVFSDIMDEAYVAFREFGGGFGMINRSGLKKPSFFAMEALNKLSTNILLQGDSFIVTKSKKGVQILLWNYCHYTQKYSSGDKSDLSYYNRYEIFENTVPKNFNIAIKNLPNHSFKIQRSEFDRNNGSIFDFWLANGAPEYPSIEQLEFFKENNHLKKSLRFCSDLSVLNLATSVAPFGFVFYEVSIIS